MHIQYRIWVLTCLNPIVLGPLRTQRYLNEVMASNSLVITDNAGEFADWMKLNALASTLSDSSTLFTNTNIAGAWSGLEEDTPWFRGVELTESSCFALVYRPEYSLLQAKAILGGAWDNASNLMRDAFDDHSELVMPYPRTLSYFAGLHHLNHLSVMFARAITSAGETSVCDFSLGATYGALSQKLLAKALYVLWSGDLNDDGQFARNLGFSAQMP